VIDDPITLVNLALTVELGKEPLASFDAPDDPEGPAIATVMRLAYPQARDALLVAIMPNFAVTRAALALLAEAPVYGFAKAYQLPQGGVDAPALCLRVMDTNLDPSWAAWPPWTWTADLWPWPWTGVLGRWQVEGRTLVTDAADLMIRYVGRIEDTTVYSPLFAEALQKELAARAAFAITRDNNTALRLRKEAEVARQRCIAADTREGAQTRSLDTTLTEVR
jgi:hypothetical protein